MPSLAQKTRSEKRVTTQAPQQPQQLHPLAIAIKVAPHSHHDSTAQRYWLFNGGKKIPVLFYQDEADYILAMFRGRYGAVDEKELRQVAEQAITQHYKNQSAAAKPQKTGVAA